MSIQQYNKLMRKIRSKDTKPEMQLRKLIYGIGCKLIRQPKIHTDFGDKSWERMLLEIGEIFTNSIHLDGAPRFRENLID